MRSLSFSSPEAVELIELPIPEPVADEALVRVEVSAICGSELRASPGTNPGHEAAGIVEHAPEGSGFRNGERVGISAVTGCGACEQCRRGVQLHCENGARTHTGMHADYVSVPVSALRRIPEGIPPQDAVLITGDALGVPVRAHPRVPARPEERVLVVGLGPVGLGHALVRAHAGADVVAIEPSGYRRTLAMNLGAAQVHPPGVHIGRPPTLVIECTGLPECIRFALATVRAGGTVIQSGACATLDLSPSEIFVLREVTYTGSWYYADEDYPAMVKLYEEGLPIQRMVTHSFAPERVAEAYRCVVSKESGKVLLWWSHTDESSET